MLLDSTPVECGRSVETARRSALAAACAHHYSRSHSRWFWGMRLHLLAAPDGTPRAAILASADQKERDVALRLFALGLRGGEPVICDKGYAGRDFEHAAAERFGAAVLRPAAQERTRPRPRTSPGSANASSRSSGRSKTASASNATTPAACTACAPGSPPSSSRSPPASGSTTTSTDRPAPSPTSPPNHRGINHLARVARDLHQPGGPALTR